MSYVIGTTSPKVRWYRFINQTQLGEEHSQGRFELLDHLDLSKASVFLDKAEARAFFKKSGLRTCRYFKF
jgi:hypothetical protein